MKDFLEAGAALVAIVAAIVAWLKANDAKVAERCARDQAEAAIQAAERSARALEGMQANASAAAADLKAEREAPAILERWINEAIAEGQQVYEASRLLETSPHFSFRKTIETEAELWAVRLAYRNERIFQVIAEAKKLGDETHIQVRNPNYQGPLISSQGGRRRFP